MENLISKFQEKLKVSKGNSIFRIFIIVISAVCSVGVILITLFAFPYQYDYPVSKIALSAETITEIAMKISGQGIELSEKQFYKQISSSDTTFVYIENVGFAIFVTNKNGCLFYYKKRNQKPLYFIKIKK